MLAFIDESGDPGLRPLPGSSRYFVVSVVVFDDEAAAEALNRRLDRLRAQLGFHPNQEFKFNKLSRDLRLRFLAAINPFAFRYYAIVLDKPWVRPADLPDRRSVRTFASTLALSEASVTLQHATVVIDGTEGRAFKRELSQALRKAVNQERVVIRKVKVQDSMSDNLLQVADMVAGSVARSFSDPENGEFYREALRRHEAAVRLWPDKERPWS